MTRFKKTAWIKAVGAVVVLTAGGVTAWGGLSNGQRRWKSAQASLMPGSGR